MREDDDERVAWGLISDIHGNLPALEAAIALLAATGARRLAFLGDYLGRGDSDGCVARIKDVADIAIVGNRDLDWQNRVSADSRSFVLGLPRVAQAGKLLLSHGDARLTPSLSTSQIARGFVRVWPQLDQRRAQVWAFGHSHHARIWRRPQHPNADVELQMSASVTIARDSAYAVNVGTTGLPFPGKGGPSVALVDFARAEIRQIPLVQD
ncbi:MAG TPA: metallophosphoesterase family protein [Chloroflexota bacterium]